MGLLLHNSNLFKVTRNTLAERLILINTISVFSSSPKSYCKTNFLDENTIGGESTAIPKNSRRHEILTIGSNSNNSLIKLLQETRIFPNY